MISVPNSSGDLRTALLFMVERPFGRSDHRSPTELVVGGVNAPLPIRYVPTGMSDADKKKQKNMLRMSRRKYRKNEYYTRKKMTSFTPFGIENAESNVTF